MEEPSGGSFWNYDTSIHTLISNFDHHVQKKERNPQRSGTHRERVVGDRGSWNRTFT